MHPNKDRQQKSRINGIPWNSKQLKKKKLNSCVYFEEFICFFFFDLAVFFTPIKKKKKCNTIGNKKTLLNKNFLNLYMSGVEDVVRIRTSSKCLNTRSQANVGDSSDNNSHSTTFVDLSCILAINNSLDDEIVRIESNRANTEDVTYINKLGVMQLLEDDEDEYVPNMPLFSVKNVFGKENIPNVMKYDDQWLRMIANVYGRSHMIVMALSHLRSQMQQFMCLEYFLLKHINASLEELLRNCPEDTMVNEEFDWFQDHSFTISNIQTNTDSPPTPNKKMKRMIETELQIPVSPIKLEVMYSALKKKSVNIHLCFIEEKTVKQEYDKFFTDGEIFFSLFFSLLFFCLGYNNMCIDKMVTPHPDLESSGKFHKPLEKVSHTKFCWIFSIFVFLEIDVQKFYLFVIYVFDFSSTDIKIPELDVKPDFLSDPDKFDVVNLFYCLPFSTSRLFMEFFCLKKNQQKDKETKIKEETSPILPTIRIKEEFDTKKILDGQQNFNTADPGWVSWFFDFFDRGN
ncbi:hypothetical protein RFI_18629 [Reticulomyxa filosa]|uniref:Uncharacterized protein n=1 Tax=Reticulomyxa filosa TaxID=46433 RepID=X6MYR7_RETFI|nr:hypothetical protein RFI_18629 [Reticulomyxa filosa]|eukprot:ETO18634.1 hypothetical protein RFI_18629 [Reticulomyxa filosa]